VDEPIQKLLETGLLGVLLVISLGAIFYLYKEVKTERDARLKDMKEVWQTDIEFRTALKNSVDILIELVKKP